MNTLFFRLLSHEDKAAALSEAVAAVSEGHALNPVAHAVNPASFRQVPGSPFAYWVSERIRRLFTELAPFEGEGRTVKQGLGDGRRLPLCAGLVGGAAGVHSGRGEWPRLARGPASVSGLVPATHF